MSLLSYDIFWDIHRSLEEDHQVLVDENMAEFLQNVAESTAATVVEIHEAFGLPAPTRLYP